MDGDNNQLKNVLIILLPQITQIDNAENLRALKTSTPISMGNGDKIIWASM